MFYALIAVIILIASFLFAMLGLGGAMVYMPLFKWAGFSVKDFAIPLALLLNGLTALIALIAYTKNKLVDWKGGATMAVAAFVFAPVGAIVSSAVPINLLLILFSFAIAAAGGRMLLLSKIPEPETIMSFKKRAFIGGIIGSFAGFAAGLLGVGGGNFIVPGLVASGFDPKKASGTTAFVVIFLSFSGFLGHIALGKINIELLALAILASILGALVGSWAMTKKLNANQVKKVIAIVLYTVALKMLWGLIK